MGFVDKLSRLLECDRICRLECDRKLSNPVNFFLLIVIGLLILLKSIKFLRLNEITLVDFDELLS